MIRPKLRTWIRRALRRPSNLVDNPTFETDPSGWRQALSSAVAETVAQDRVLLTRGRGPVDPAGLVAYARELGLELDEHQAELLAGAWQRPLLTPAQMSIASRRASKAYAHRLAVETALAAGEHVHVHEPDGITCKSEVCSPEDLARPGRRLAGMPTRIYDEAWSLSPADVAAMRAPGSAAAEWAAANDEAGPVDPPQCPTLNDAGFCKDDRHAGHTLAGFGLLASGGYDYEPAGLIHGKLLDDSRCCPVAERGGLATTFLSTVTCQPCRTRMLEVLERSGAHVDPTAAQLAHGEQLLDEVAGLVDEAGRG